MREYIVPVGNTDRDYEEMFIGFIRKRQELIRCKDCKYYDSEHEVCCVYVSYRLAKDADDYCSRAEKE